MCKGKCKINCRENVFVICYLHVFALVSKIIVLPLSAKRAVLQNELRLGHETKLGRCKVLIDAVPRNGVPGKKIS